MLTPTATRVARNTAAHINCQIRHATEQNVAHYKVHPELIEARLQELDREWDVERVVETSSPLLTLTGLLLGLRVNRKWLLLSAGVQLFFLQHAMQGWCPPIPLLRRLGVRTSREIEDERHALLQLRASAS